MAYAMAYDRARDHVAAAARSCLAVEAQTPRLAAHRPFVRPTARLAQGRRKLGFGLRLLDSAAAQRIGGYGSFEGAVLRQRGTYGRCRRQGD